ncbi:MAG: hypothetical protein WC503_02870 [Candidatus Shapirobacteria bacterium]
MIHLYKYRKDSKHGALKTDTYLVFEHPHRSPALFMSMGEIKKMNELFHTKKEAVLATEKLATKLGQELALHN